MWHCSNVRVTDVGGVCLTLHLPLMIIVTGVCCLTLLRTCSRAQTHVRAKPAITNKLILSEEILFENLGT